MAYGKEDSRVSIPEGLRVREGAGEEYFFTFGVGHPFKGNFVRIPGTWDEARERMIKVFGKNWSNQYDRLAIQQYALEYRKYEVVFTDTSVLADVIRNDAMVWTLITQDYRGNVIDMETCSSEPTFDLNELVKEADELAGRPTGIKYELRVSNINGGDSQRIA